MVWIPKWDTFFIPIPKTGTQTVKEILGRRYGKVEREMQTFSHPCYLDAAMITRDHPNPVTFFTVVREPRERLISAIRYAFVRLHEQIEPEVYVDRVFDQILSKNTVSPFVPVPVADESLKTRKDWELRWIRSSMVNNKVTVRKNTAFGLTAQSWWLDGAEGKGVHVFALEHLDELCDFIGERKLTREPLNNETEPFMGTAYVTENSRFEQVLDRYSDDFKLYEDALSRNLRPF